MVELSLMASAAFSPAILHHDQAVCRPPHKDMQALLPGYEKKEEILGSGCLKLDAPRFELPCQSTNLLSEFNQQSVQVFKNKKPVLIDVQDALPDSVLFSFGIAEQYAQHEKLLQYLKSGSVVEGEGVNLSLLSDLLGLCTLAIDMPLLQYVPLDAELSLYEVGISGSQPFICPQRQLRRSESLSNVLGNAMVTECSDARVLFTGTRAEMNNLLSVISEFYLPKISSNGCKQALLVPYFTRFNSKKRANVGVPSSKLQIQTNAPAYSPDTIKLKPLPKKKRNKNAGRERDFYNKNYFRACETLMSFILNHKCGKKEILSLKKSSSEISQFLTQFSAGIAGTGLAVLFSVIHKVASVRMPFCSGKLWSTGFGFVLLWTSLGVNGLRDTIMHISRNSSKLGLKEDEIIAEVQQSVNVVLFRAAALMAVTMLRFC